MTRKTIFWASSVVRSKVLGLLFLFIVYCCFHYLWGFVFGPCFVMQYLVSFLDLKPSLGNKTRRTLVKSVYQKI